MAAIPKRLRVLLDHYKMRWRAVQAAVGLAMTLCAIVAGVGLGVLVDRALLGAPRGLRWALLAAIALAVVVLLLRYVLTPLVGRMPDRRAAARLGRNFPNMAEDLVTGVELSRDQEFAGASKGLVDVALDQIDRRSAAVSWRDAVPLDRLRRLAAAFGVLAIALGMAYLFRPEAVSNSIGRLFRPSREDFFSYTRLNVEPGDEVLRKGDALEVRFSVSGRPVLRATLDVRPAGEPFSREVPILAGVGDWESSPLLDGLRYRVKAGDNLSPWYTVRVVPAPALAAKSVRVTLPAYTDRPETTVENILGPVTVVLGPERDRVAQPSTVVIQVRPEPRGDDPKLVCSAQLTAGDKTWPMTPEGDLLVSPRLTPTRDTDYQISLKDGYGLSSRAAETISIKVVPDTLPLVIIPQPGSDLSLLPGAKVPISASATDDFGLRDLKLQACLVHDKGPSDPALENWKTLPTLADSAGKRTVQRLEGNAVLALADFNPVPGDHIDIRAVAADYADDALFRTASSAVYRINIISYSEHLAALFKDLQKIAGELDLAARREAAEAKQTGEMKDAPAENDKRSEAAEAQQRQEELRDKVKDLERQIAEAMQNLSDNPLTPTSLLTDLDQMEKGMEDAESKPMQQASDELSKAAQSKPSDSAQQQQQQQQQSLQNAQQSEQQAEEQLAQLSKEMDRIQQRKLLDILADEAERLARDQSDARAMTGKTATEISGRPASELPQADLDKVVRLAGFQELIASGVATLDKDIEKVLNDLSQEKADDAEKASDALDLMNDDRLPETADAVASQISENNLFSQTSRQQDIADSLKEVADTLRTSSEMTQAEKELQEFIRRQKELNARMDKLIGGDVKAADPDAPLPKPNARPGAPEAGNAAPRPPQRNLTFIQGPNGMVVVQGGGAAGFVVVNGQVAMPGQGIAQPGQAPAPATASDVKTVGGKLGERQGVLQQDVSDHSAAMRALFKELGMGKLETADKLDQASAEMGLAAQDLPVPSLPSALEHGKKALALLEEAAQTLPEDEEQAQDQQQGDQDQMSLDALMRLAKIIGQMKALKDDTGSADRAKMQSPDAFPQQVMNLARRQGRIRYDTTKLARKLQDNLPDPAQVVAAAGGKMDISHSALESGDAGADTRQAQSEAIQMLEALLSGQEQSMGSMLSSAAMMAMQSLSMGSQGGGYRGGTNGPLAPATLDESGFRVSSRQKFDEKLGAGFEAEFPPEFRALLNSYFNQVRREERP